MNNSPAHVSVIVPVYRTDIRYLKQCVESLIHQTCRDIEIIMVDDGSPDQCGVICDGYAADDTRIRVIHQRNQGLSAARNHGMDAATGEYVMFVDADDWIERDCVETALTKIRTEQADVLCFQRCVERGHTIRFPAKPSRRIGEAELEVIRRHLLMNEKNYGGFDLCTAWGKLYRRDTLVKNAIRLPEGVIFEDVAFNLYVFEKARSAYLLDYVGYHYRWSENSITRGYDPQIYMKVIDGILPREAYVRACHDGDEQYERLLGICAINMLSAIERNCTFNRSCPLKMREVIRITRLYLYDDRIERMISRCRFTDCKSVRTALRYVLERKAPLPVYYICMKLIRCLI